MVRLIAGVFLVLHGLVHLLYLGQSQRLFELQPGLAWPDGSWALSKLLGDPATRLVASASCALAAIGFVAGGAGVLAGQRWWRPLVVGSAALSALVWILLWDGQWQRLPDQGAIAVLINAAILVAALVLRWPAWQFQDQCRSAEVASGDAEGAEELRAAEATPGRALPSLCGSLPLCGFLRLPQPPHQMPGTRR